MEIQYMCAYEHGKTYSADINKKKKKENTGSWCTKNNSIRAGVKILKIYNLVQS